MRLSKHRQLEYVSPLSDPRANCSRHGHEYVHFAVLPGPATGLGPGMQDANAESRQRRRPISASRSRTLMVIVTTCENCTPTTAVRRRVLSQGKITCTRQPGVSEDR